MTTSPSCPTCQGMNYFPCEMGYCSKCHDNGKCTHAVTLKRIDKGRRFVSNPDEQSVS